MPAAGFLAIFLGSASQNFTTGHSGATIAHLTNFCKWVRNIIVSHSIPVSFPWLSPQPPSSRGQKSEARRGLCPRDSRLALNTRRRSPPRFWGNGLQVCRRRWTARTIPLLAEHHRSQTCPQASPRSGLVGGISSSSAHSTLHSVQSHFILCDAPML